ncbi:MAG: Hsp20/alpha crystallin family protein [Planctomycetota bacterium]
MANCTPKNRLGEFTPAGLATVDGLFEHFFRPPAARQQAATWGAPASVWESDDRLYVEIDAPGVAKEHVDVTFDHGQLTIAIERTLPEGRHYWHNERGYGKVTRTVALPETVDADSLEAELTDGLLLVSVAKLPEAKPRRIELK